MKNHQIIKHTLFSLVCLFLSQSAIAEQIDDENYMQLQTENKKNFSVYVVGPKKSQKGILLIHG